MSQAAPDEDARPGRRHRQEGDAPRHHLRHTYATYLVAAGTDIKTVSSLIGHANGAMTLNTYASADSHARRSAARTIAEQMAARPRDSDHDEGSGTMLRLV